jgi:hypothetical protein
MGTALLRLFVCCEAASSNERGDSRPKVPERHADSEYSTPLLGSQPRNSAPPSAGLFLPGSALFTGDAALHALAQLQRDLGLDVEP